MNMSALKFINMFFLQFFFIRLGRKIEDDGTFIKWEILKWVVPFTGWKRSNYIYLFKK